MGARLSTSPGRPHSSAGRRPHCPLHLVAACRLRCHDDALLYSYSHSNQLRQPAATLPGNVPYYLSGCTARTAFVLLGNRTNGGSTRRRARRRLWFIPSSLPYCPRLFGPLLLAQSLTCSVLFSPKSLYLIIMLTVIISATVQYN